MRDQDMRHARHRRTDALGHGGRASRVILTFAAAGDRPTEEEVERALGLPAGAVHREPGVTAIACGWRAYSVRVDASAARGARSSGGLKILSAMTERPAGI